MTATDSAFWDQYKDPRWQKKRLEIFERDGWLCTCCEEPGRELHVHHKKYDFGKKPWEYPDENLETLCKECHQDQTKATRALKAEIPKLGIGVMARVLGYAVGQRLDTFVHDLDYDPIVTLLDHEMACGLACAVLDVLGWPVSAEVIIHLAAGERLDLRDVLALVRKEQGR